MKRISSGAALMLVAVVTLTSGCVKRHHDEVDARISGAEDMATAARVKADEAYLKSEQALKAALQAQRAVEDVNKRSGRMQNKK